MRTDGWIPLSERKPTQEELDRGVWWIKNDWKKAAFKTWVCVNNLPHNQSIWSWRMDPLPPEPPTRQIPEWESEFNQWKREVEADKVNPGIIDSWYGGWIRREIMMNEEAARLRLRVRELEIKQEAEEIWPVDKDIQIRELSAMVEKLKLEVRDIKNSNDCIDRQCSAVYKENLKLLDAVAEKNHEIKDLKSQIKACHQAMGERDLEINELNLECKRLKQDCDRLLFINTDRSREKLP